ncbi:hypothetical protein F0L74_24820 [Chitinophaga agrisoli]|uniref:Tetratricopeptide repeat protein n=1 Tax=Chitinophaga agrisoli TaxID=2607653 RepID=A0A5B2VL38_9BACT|nr:hypothetical protein [Chitinophaga agrisoli]KAA2239428.1 hypothetical protein F0L74_24820 [Chitinophaga agrisoli]
MKRTLQVLDFLLPVLLSCHGNYKTPTNNAISAMELKRGKIILCGPEEQQLGDVAFTTSCSGKVQKDFNTGISLLHSFEYDEAEKAFAKVIDEDPGCAIAYWGVAMCNYHPLWAPPTPRELEKGARVMAVAESLKKRSERETDYIAALAPFYHNWRTTTHADRCADFEKGMERLHAKYPDDQEAAIFYALALNGAADPADKTFAKQKKAGEILTALSASLPNHPGITHYIIHSYDYPELAELALPAARRYASIAPSSAHAQHMPSHIFTRLGLWQECANANLIATVAARCYAENTGIKGHWDEELHSMDYLVYAYLQQGQNAKAREQYDYLNTIQEVHPVNFKVAYAFAAIPARYLLENRLWQDAAALRPHQANLPWEQYPWQKAIIHFTRLMGAAHTGALVAARIELDTLNQLHDALAAQQDVYKANQVDIQRKTGAAWILLKEGKRDSALLLMHAAANMEDNTQKHPVTPGEVLPARELLGDMLLQLSRPEEALAAYEEDLKQHVNRFNGLYGAAQAAEQCHKKDKAAAYYRQLVKISSTGDASRPELTLAGDFLKGKGN